MVGDWYCVVAIELKVYAVDILFGNGFVENTLLLLELDVLVVLADPTTNYLLGE